MTIRPILLYPHPALRAVAKPVDAINEDTRTLAQDMIETMYNAGGIGLAAPQIGVLQRVLVFDCTDRDLSETAHDQRKPKSISNTDYALATTKATVMINPNIIGHVTDQDTNREGCLSFPNHYGNVTRPNAIRLKWQTWDAKTNEATFTELEAVCIQHEIDHLNGVLFIDKLTRLKRSIIIQKMKKHALSANAQAQKDA